MLSGSMTDTNLPPLVHSELPSAPSTISWKNTESDARPTGRRGDRKMVTCLAPGWEWSLFKNKGRNSPCLCGSVKKWKKCCQSKMPGAVPTREMLLKLKADEEHKAKTDI